MRRSIGNLVVCVATVTLLGGCGSTSEPKSSSGSSTPSVAPEGSEPPAADPSTPAPDANNATAAVEQWIAAYEDSDGAAACALQTDEYTQKDLAASIKQGTITKGANCEDGVVAGAALGRAFGFDMSNPKVSLTSDNGDEATVQVTYKDGTKGNFVMSLKEGKWLVSEEIAAGN